MADLSLAKPFIYCYFFLSKKRQRTKASDLTFKRDKMLIVAIEVDGVSFGLGNAPNLGLFFS